MDDHDLSPDSYKLAQMTALNAVMVMENMIDPPGFPARYDDDFIHIFVCDGYEPPDGCIGIKVLILDKTQPEEDPIDVDNPAYGVVLLAYVYEDDDGAVEVEIEEYDHETTVWVDHFKRVMLHAIQVWGATLWGHRHLN